MLPDPDPVALVSAWLALEALQPQTFASQEALIGDERPRKTQGKPAKAPARALVPFDVESGLMPWETPAGDRVQLNLEPEESVRWYLPVAFVRMRPAVEMLVRDIEQDGPERETASGVAVLALVAFDERGFAAPSRTIVSSFGWACGEVLAGRIAELHRFVDVHEELCREIGEALVEQAPDGRQVPTTRRGFAASMTALMRCLALPRDVLERPRVAIRAIGDTDRDPVDIINSFFLRDLHAVRRVLRDGGGGHALSAYLGSVKPAFRRDVLADKAVLEELVAPGRVPLGRWPAPKPAKLVTLQQAAVNAALRDLADGGLMSVNGPPGTGKTTLLRDVVAAVIVDRADALLGFEDPEAAFSAIDLVAEGGRRQTLHTVAPALRGHGIVVASSNNAAVRNVSAELPQASAVAPEFAARYFAGTADAVQGREGGSWGLIAAVLGNRSNRAAFVENAWWHPDWGLEKYFAAASGRFGSRAKEPPPKILEAEKPPRNRSEARERWRRACLDYREKRLAVARMRALREQIRTALGTGAAAQQAAEDAKAAYADATGRAREAASTRDAAEKAVTEAEAAVADVRRLLDGHAMLRPGILSRVLGRDGEWRRSQEQALALMTQTLAERQTARNELVTAGERAAIAEDEASAASAALLEAEERLGLLRELEAQCPEVCGGTQAGPTFWQGAHEEIHTAAPWSDAAFTSARDELFAAAIRLHRAFIDAAARPLKSNLRLIMDQLKGRRIPSGANLHLGDLWDSFFLVVPLVSTTFASFDRLMDGMDSESIGWLIVDEAGQATPQAAVGALWRSRRAVIIGDPLQIEPVSTLPEGLVRAICASHGAHPDLWGAPRASVQTLADSASSLMTLLGAGTGAREIGLPLLVHRRCQDPMFSISNEIAYGGLMVHAPGDPRSPIAEALSPWLPRSCWIDVVTSAPKWSALEGDVVLDLLRRLGERGVREPKIYIISPFREVADRLRRMVVKSGVLDGLGIAQKAQRAWGETNIGTVHTFQGKEAEAVLLVLRAPAPTSYGSRTWAGGTPNILNVAATRAKQAMYLIGHRDAWATAGVFAVAAAELPAVGWPPEGKRDGGVATQEQATA